MEELVTRALLDLHPHLYSHSYIFAFEIQLYNSNFTERVKKIVKKLENIHEWIVEIRRKGKMKHTLLA